MHPNGLNDAYVIMQHKQKTHTPDHYNYCKTAILKTFYGYSDSVWGLTASDIQNG